MTTCITTWLHWIAADAACGIEWMCLQEMELIQTAIAELAGKAEILSGSVQSAQKGSTWCLYLITIRFTCAPQN